MKRYYSIGGTPLSFHSFIRYFSLPLSVIYIAADLVECLTNYTRFNWFDTYYIGYDVIFIILGVIIFIGFFRWKAYAWYCMMAILALNPLYLIGSSIICSVYQPSGLTKVLELLATRVIFSVLVGIYYIKRKPLFVLMPNSEADIISGEESLPLSIKYCRNCGAQLKMPDSRFCGECGAKTEDE